MFLYENVPQLKYHNPSVEFVVERHNEGDSRIELLTGQLYDVIDYQMFILSPQMMVV